jgi:hypothetical protein
VQLAEILGEHGHGTEIMNIGTPAQGLFHQMCWFLKEGYKYKPDIVISTDYATVGHAVARCDEQDWCPVVEDGLLYTTTPTLRGRAVAFAKNIGIVFYSYYLLHAFDDAPTQQADPGKEARDGNATSSKQELPEVIENFHTTVEQLRRASADDVVTQFLHLPLSYQVHVEDTSRFWDRGPIDPYEERAELIATTAALREAGIPMLMPLERLIAEGEKERMYFWLDVHMTPAGNRVIAEELAKSLLPRLGQGS